MCSASSRKPADELARGRGAGLRARPCRKSRAEALLLLGDIDQRQGRAERRASLGSSRLEELAGSTLKTLRLRSESGIRHEHVRRRLPGRARPADRGTSGAAYRHRRGDRRPRARRRGPPPHRGRPLLPGHDFSAAESELQLLSRARARPRQSPDRSRGEHPGSGPFAYYPGNRPEEAERLCLQARTWFERTGDSYFQVQNLVPGPGHLRARGWLGPTGEGRGVAARGASHRAADRRLGLFPEYVLAPRPCPSWAQDRLDDAREIAAFAARGVPEEDPHSSAWLFADPGPGVATTAGEPLRRPRLRSPRLVRLFEELKLPARPRGRALCLRPLAAVVRRGGRRLGQSSSEPVLPTPASVADVRR